MLAKLFKRFREPKAADAAGVPAVPLKGRVLVVDDDPVVRKVLNLKLRAAGYRVFEAADGATALTSVRQDTPDVIIMDIHFVPEPGITWDGFSLMRWLGCANAGIRPPVIMITADTSEAVRGKALAAGAAGFFPKPIDMPALSATIETLIPSAAPAATTA